MSISLSTTFRDNSGTFQCYNQVFYKPERFVGHMLTTIRFRVSSVGYVAWPSTADAFQMLISKGVAIELGSRGNWAG
jgi:hypothetical protein